VEPATDDPDITHLWAAVDDVDDPDEVVDLVIERALDLIVEEGIPVYVEGSRVGMRRGPKMNVPGSASILFPPQTKSSRPSRI
jgi:hypothetical protein